MPLAGLMPLLARSLRRADPTPEPALATEPEPLPRCRGQMEQYWFDYGYGDIGTDIDWEWRADGAMLTSTLPDGRHAPVFDVDQPIEVLDGASGSPAVLVVTLRPAVAVRVADRLHFAGFIDADQARAYEIIARWRGRWSRRRIEARYRLPFPLVAVPSRTPGHFHLMVEEAMDWPRAQALGHALVGVIDRRWWKRTGQWPGMVVRAPADPAPVG